MTSVSIKLDIHFNAEEVVNAVENALRKYLPKEYIGYFTKYGIKGLVEKSVREAISEIVISRVEKRIDEIFGSEEVVKEFQRLNRKALRLLKRYIGDEEWLSNIVAQVVFTELRRWLSSRTTARVLRDDVVDMAIEKFRESEAFRNIVNTVIDVIRERADIITNATISKVATTLSDMAYNEAIRPKYVKPIVKEIAEKVHEKVREEIEKYVKDIIDEVVDYVLDEISYEKIRLKQRIVNEVKKKIRNGAIEKLNAQ